MQLLAEGLARSGRLDGAGVQVVAGLCGRRVPTAVLAHPQLVRTPDMLRGLAWDAVEMLVSRGADPEVLADVAAAVSSRALADVAARAHPVRVLEMALAQRAVAGDMTAAWECLRAGPGRVRRTLVTQCASDAAGWWIAERRWVWLAAAVQCPDLLVELACTGPPGMRDALARFAVEMSAGRDPVALFTQEVLELAARGVVPDWAGRPETAKAVSLVDMVEHTGLPGVARGVLEMAVREQLPRLWAAIVTHPHLAGTDVAAAAQVAMDAWVVQRAGRGALAVPGAAQALRSAERGLLEWVGDGHDSPAQLALAWQVLQDRTRSRGELIVNARVAAGVLMCADRGGRLAAAVREWLITHSGDTWSAPVHPGMPAGSALQDGGVGVLVALAGAVHGGPGVASMRLGDLDAVWRELDHPVWLGRLVGDYLATLPVVGDRGFVHALLSVGDGFTGTLKDLVDTATAITT